MYKVKNHSKCELGVGKNSKVKLLKTLDIRLSNHKCEYYFQLNV